MRFSKKASSALLAFQNKHILLFWTLPAAISCPGEKTSKAPLRRSESFPSLLWMHLSSKMPLSFCQSAELHCWMWLNVSIRAVMWLREAVLLANYGASCCFWRASILRGHISSHWSTAVLPNKGFPTLKVSCAASHFIPAFHTSFLAFDIRSASRWAESSPACDPLWKRAARQHAYFLWYCLHMFSSRISLLGVNHIYMSMCNSETPRCHLHLVLVQPSAGSSGAVAKDLWLRVTLRAGVPRRWICTSVIHVTLMSAIWVLKGWFAMPNLQVQSLWLSTQLCACNGCVTCTSFMPLAG